MILDNYAIIYLLSNIFFLYVIYRFLHMFFDERLTSRKVELISYLVYFVAISVLYLSLKTPLINLVGNLVLFFMLSMNYVSTWKSRLTATVFMYAILICIEAITVLGLQYLNLNASFKGTDVELIAALISSKILSYMVVLILSNFKMVRNQVNLSVLHWLAIFLIPIGTLFSTFLLITSETGNSLALTITSISVLFLINIFVFYLYDVLVRSYQQKFERELLWQQNEAYVKQFELIRQSQDKMRTFRHDMKNHLSVLKSLVEKQDVEATLTYSQGITEFLDNPDEYARSGNSELDGILNYKIHEAREKGVQVDLKLTIPERLAIQPFDLSVILGNLLDNAIEAASLVTAEKKIRLEIFFKRNLLHIQMVNPYEGELNQQNGRFGSTKNDHEHHGIGLNSVKRSVEKYNGALELSPKDGKFHTKVLLYNQGAAITV